jgi:nucleotide-binding universal stress UspA family protein
MNILIAVDGSPHSQITLNLGAQFATLTDSAVTILTVVRSNFQKNTALTRLKKAREAVSGKVKTVETKFRTGKPVTEIIREINEGSYGVVVVGSQPVAEGIKRIFGPTLDQIIAKSPCPVLIAKNHLGDLKRILICDSGAEGRPLIDHFISHFRDTIQPDSEVTVLHVMSQMSAGPGVRGWQLRADAEELIEAHTPEGDILEHDIHEMEYFDIEPEVVVRHGWVVDEIIAESEEGKYGLVVIGAHRGEGWQNLLLDDIAHQIVVQSNLPVLVIK